MGPWQMDLVHASTSQTPAPKLLVRPRARRPNGSELRR